MDNQFVILAHVPTDSVTSGFIPAIRKRGIPLLVVTDQPERHQALVDRGILQPDEVLTSDVFNPIAVLNTLSQYRVHPEAVFTNSDHLQSSSAIVAQFYSLPSKNWRACYRAKNKLVMRQAIAKAGLDSLWFDCLTNPAQLSTLNIPYPCITKPVEGVASENVALIHSREELESFTSNFWLRNPGQPLLLEEYIAGPLHTLETIGDGKDLKVLGSFETYLSAPPYFIELGQSYNRKIEKEIQQKLFGQLDALGVGFGTCHTEFVLTPDGPKLIEVNYRNIGDQSDFLVAQALQYDLFSAVVALYLGEGILEIPEHALSAQIHCQIAQRSGVVSQVPNMCDIEREGCQISFEPLCAVGDYHEQDFSNRDYMSILRGTGPSDNVLSKVMHVLSSEYEVEIASDTAPSGEAA